MRRDIKKVLVDCYRIGNRRKKGGRTTNYEVRNYRKPISIQDLEEDEEGFYDLPDYLPNKTSSKPTYYKKGSRKEFGENLSPLKRFLEKSVGRKWDDVYSELCQNCDRNGAVSGHIFDHIWGYVKPFEEIYLVNGVPHLISYGTPLWRYYWIDAKGYLRKVPKKEPKKVKSKENFVSIGKNIWMSQHPENKLWYVLTFKKQEYTKKRGKAVPLGTTTIQ